MVRRIPQIGIVMASDKDLPLMKQAAAFLNALNIPFEMTALSPYRTPDQVRDYGRAVERNGYEVVIAGAGGTNELACMIASYTNLPVIGIPLRAQNVGVKDRRVRHKLEEFRELKRAEQREKALAVEAVSLELQGETDEVPRF